MKLLLDTHALLWAIGKTDELSAKIIKEIKDAKNGVFVSAVSLWEIAVKFSIGKLSVDFQIEKIPEYCKIMGFELIPLNPVEALNGLKLPLKDNHKDPFDRMLIYQCIASGYVLVSRDARIKAYKENGLKYLW